MMYCIGLYCIVECCLAMSVSAMNRPVFLRARGQGLVKSDL